MGPDSWHPMRWIGVVAGALLMGRKCWAVSLHVALSWQHAAATPRQDKATHHVPRPVTPPYARTATIPTLAPPPPTTPSRTDPLG